MGKRNRHKQQPNEREHSVHTVPLLGRPAVHGWVTLTWWARGTRTCLQQGCLLLCTYILNLAYNNYCNYFTLPSRESRVQSSMYVCTHVHTYIPGGALETRPTPLCILRGWMSVISTPGGEVLCFRHLGQVQSLAAMV